MIEVKITGEVLDAAACIRAVTLPECGGINVFIGTVRSATKGKRVVQLQFEAYEKMALKEMYKIGEQIMQQWPVHTIVMHHRTGTLAVGEVPVVIAVGAAHREAAFAACKYAIDTLKQTVPIWKKEVFEDGAVWVSAHP